MAIKRFMVNVVALLFLCFAVTGFLSGCGKSDTGSAVNKVVDDLSGKSTKEIGDLLKKQINTQSAQQQEKAKEGENPEEPAGNGKGQD